MAASPAAYGSRESAANESVLECDPSPEPIRHRPVARSIIAAPSSNLPLCGFESSTLGGLVAIFFALFDWMAELLWFRAIGYEGVSGDSASPRSRCLQSPSFLCSSPKVCEPKHQRAA